MTVLNPTITAVNCHYNCSEIRLTVMNVELHKHGFARWRYNVMASTAHSETYLLNAVTWQQTMEHQRYFAQCL